MNGVNAAELAEQHVYLAEACATRFIAKMPPHVDTDAYRGTALEALVVAAQRFDATRGVPFNVFAWGRMWWAMTDESRLADWHSRLERVRGETLDGLPLSGAPISLDKTHDSEDGGGGSLVDLLPARGGDFADIACQRLDVLAALRELPARYRVALLASMIGVPQLDLAPVFGVGGQSRVSQIEKAARRQLVEKVAA